MELRCCYADFDRPEILSYLRGHLVFAVPTEVSAVENLEIEFAVGIVDPLAVEALEQVAEVFLLLYTRAREVTDRDGESGCRREPGQPGG